MLSEQVNPCEFKINNENKYMKYTALYFGFHGTVVAEYNGNSMQVLGRVDRFEFTAENIISFWNALQDEHAPAKKIA